MRVRARPKTPAVAHEGTRLSTPGIDDAVGRARALSFEGQRRRRLAAAALAAGCGLWHVPAAHAGAQIEEPLADAVRSALRAAVGNSAPPRPSFVSTGERLEYLRWLGEMSARLRARQSDAMARVEFLETVW